MKKQVFTILFFVTYILNYAQVTVKLELQNNKYKQAYFCSVNGSKIKVISESAFKNNNLIFQFTDIDLGLYEILFPDNKEINIVIGSDKNIFLKANYNTLPNNIEVLSGNENKTYYDFIKFRKSQIYLLNKLTKSLKKSNQSSERIGFYKGVSTYKIQHFADSLYAVDTSLFVAKLIKSQVIPDLNLYSIKHFKEAQKYKYDIEFLMLHFFDNIDFSDENLIHTDILYRTIKSYIGKIVLPRNETGFNYANDFIIGKIHNQKVKNAVVYELLKIYEKSRLETVYLKLYNDYIKSNKVMLQQSDLAEFQQKNRIIKKTKQGLKAVNFTYIDNAKKTYKLQELKSNFNVLVFYKHSTNNIKSTIKQLNDIYKNYHKNGVNIIAISLDSDFDVWNKFLQKNKINFPNYLIKKDQIKIVNESYNTWSLPSIYIINKELTITAKPINVDYVKKECEKVFEN